MAASTKPFALQEVDDDLLILIMNKMTPKSYAKMHRAKKDILQFLCENHWRISICVPKTLSFWFTYPVGAGKGCFMTNVMIDRERGGSPLQYNIITAFNNFAGFCFESVDADRLDIYEPKMSEIQRWHLLRFLRNRIWRNVTLVMKKEINPAIVEAISPKILELKELPAKIPPSVQEVHLSYNSVIEVEDKINILLDVSYIFIKHVNHWNELPHFFERLFRMWKRNRHGSIQLFQMGITWFLLEDMALDAAGEALPRCDDFKPITQMLEGQLHLPINVETVVSEDGNKAIVKLIVQCTAVEKPACIAVLLAKKDQIICALQIAFCTDMDNVDVFGSCLHA